MSTMIIFATPLATYRWEMSPKSEMAEKWPAKWPAAIFRGRPEMAEKMAGQMADSGNCPAICPAIFLAISGLPRKMATGHLAGHFRVQAHFQPAAGQWGRKIIFQEWETDPVQCKRGFKRGLLRDKFGHFEAIFWSYA